MDGAIVARHRVGIRCGTNHRCEARTLVRVENGNSVRLPANRKPTTPVPRWCLLTQTSVCGRAQAYSLSFACPFPPPARRNQDCDARRYGYHRHSRSRIFLARDCWCDEWIASHFHLPICQPIFRDAEKRSQIPVDDQHVVKIIHVWRINPVSCIGNQSPVISSSVGTPAGVCAKMGKVRKTSIVASPKTDDGFDFIYCFD